MAITSPPGSSISLQRSVTGDPKHSCDSCASKEEKGMLLDIMMDHNWISLCPGCELHLIALLLQNYLRRKRRGKGADLSKEPEIYEVSD